MTENKLEKGAMRKLHPFNPDTNHPTTNLKLGNWQAGDSKDYRNTVPTMDPDAKARALHKLGGATQVRRNPQTNEREFLLHRGMDTNEHKAVDKGNFVTHEGNDKTSWTPNYKIAHHFGQIYGGDKGKVVSAWVPEAAIHHVPKAIGATGGGISTAKTWTRGRNEYAHEHEIIVSPGHHFTKAGPLHVQQAKNESFAEVPTLEQRLRAKFGREKEAAEPSVYTPSWMKKSAEFGDLAKAWKLAKGAMRRLAPFDPQSAENTPYRKDLNTWQDGMNDHAAMDFRDTIVKKYANRSQLPNERTRMLHKLSTMAKVRKNSNGEREFLLHRGMGHNEMKNATQQPGVLNHDYVSSWTPDWHVAHSFADQYNKGGLGGALAAAMGRKTKGAENHIGSAWVNEKHIQAMPHQVTGDKNFKHEREVFVAPDHNSQVADKVDTVPQDTVNKRINDRAFKPFANTNKPKLKKAVPTKRIQQAEGENWNRERVPRQAKYDFSKLSEVSHHRIGPGLYHHTGKFNNLTFHVLSRGEDPNSRRLAAMATGHVNGKEYLIDAHRANGADRGKGYVQRLWDVVQERHPDVTVAKTDYERAQMSNWKDHHPDLYHGLIPDLPAKHLDAGIAGASIVGKGDGPTAIIKPPLTDKIRDKYPNGIPSKHAHFVHPDFTTSHREAMYHLLANDVFGLGNFVPRTTVFKHPVTGQPTSAMEYIPRSRKYSEPSQLAHRERSGDLHRMAIMDMVLGNNDRHRRNIILDQYGEPKLIDHGLAFDYGGLSKNPMPVYAEHLLKTPMPQQVHKWIQGLNPTRLHDTMVSRGAPASVADIAAKRLSSVKDWSANNSSQVSNTPQGKLGDVYGKTQAYSLDKTPAEMDRAARVADVATEIGAENKDE